MRFFFSRTIFLSVIISFRLIFSRFIVRCCMCSIFYSRKKIFIWPHRVWYFSIRKPLSNCILNFNNIIRSVQSHVFHIETVLPNKSTFCLIISSEYIFVFIFLLSYLISFELVIFQYMCTKQALWLNISQSQPMNNWTLIVYQVLLEHTEST